MKGRGCGLAVIIGFFAAAGVAAALLWVIGTGGLA
jgi:hypothetical protein